MIQILPFYQWSVFPLKEKSVGVFPEETSIWTSSLNREDSTQDPAQMRGKLGSKTSKAKEGHGGSRLG